MRKQTSNPKSENRSPKELRTPNIAMLAWCWKEANIKVANVLLVMAELSQRRKWRVAHGTVFALLMMCALLVPVLRRWPWLWLVPLAAYFVIVGSIPLLRQSLSWLKVGRVTLLNVGITLGVAMLTTTVLVVFHCGMRPDVRSFKAGFPLEALGGVVVAGVVFCLLNATLEELVFRGVLFDALEAEWGMGVTIAVTALAFGLGHFRGYPPGLAGACLAGCYGLVLGLLRYFTGGLAMPILAHIGADATIYSIVVKYSEGP